MSGYMDPIAIVLKFHRGLNLMIQDKIAESGTDRLHHSHLSIQPQLPSQLGIPLCLAMSCSLVNILLAYPVNVFLAYPVDKCTTYAINVNLTTLLQVSPV
jgi:hypothetical protein